MSFEDYREECYDFLAGAIGGSVGVAVAMPFDLVKVRLQSGIEKGSPFQATANIFRTEGLLAFWKGMVPPLVANVPISAIGFATFGQMERLLTQKFDAMEHHRHQAHKSFNNQSLDLKIPSVPLQYQSDFYRNELAKRYTLPASFTQQLNQFQSPPNPTSPTPFAAFHDSTTLSSVADRPATPNWWAVFWAGCWSGLLACIIATPSELLKIKEQNTIGATTPATMTLIRDMVAKHGPVSLFRGFWCTVVRDAPSVGLYFLSYHWVKWLLRTETWTPQVIVDGRLITSDESKSIFGSIDLTDVDGKVHNHNHNHNHTHNIRINWEHNVTHSLWVPLIAGSVAGPIGWACTYPVDVVKTRLQTMPFSEYKKTSMLKCSRDILAQHGWKFFTKGLGTATVGAIPMNAATFLAYEMTLNWCKSNSVQKTQHHPV